MLEIIFYEKDVVLARIGQGKLRFTANTPTLNLILENYKIVDYYLLNSYPIGVPEKPTPIVGHSFLFKINTEDTLEQVAEKLCLV